MPPRAAGDLIDDSVSAFTQTAEFGGNISAKTQNDGNSTEIAEIHGKNTSADFRYFRQKSKKIEIVRLMALKKKALCRAFPRTNFQ